VIAVVLYLLNYRRLANEFVLGALTLWLLVELFKLAFRRSRPYIRLAQTRIVGLRMRGQSFPSGHTSQAFFLVTLLVQHFHVEIWLAIFLYVAAALVAVTRMYVGAHYPRDVAAGAMLGSSWGLLGILIDNFPGAKIIIINTASQPTTGIRGQYLRNGDWQTLDQRIRPGVLQVIQATIAKQQPRECIRRNAGRPIRSH
jgi:membrane-associated phospholipid phosphatase